MKSHLSHKHVTLSSIPTRRFIFSAGIAFLLAFTLFPSTAYAGNSFMTGKLRVDLAKVNLAHDYVVSIKPGGLPTNGSTLDYTTGWFGIHIPDFLQVGYMTRRTGVHWFVEEFSSSASIQCFHGTYRNDIGGGAEACYGDINDRATIGNFHKVELVTYPGQGFWIARVYDQNGNPLDVARLDFSTSTNKITKASVTMEEGYVETSDPHLLAKFWFSHPKYWIGGTGDPFAEWPASTTTQKNTITPSPSGICPTYYYAIRRWGGDARVWYAGTKTSTAGICSGNIF